MKDLLGFYGLPYWLLLYSVAQGERFTYNGVTYEPRDFSYWGA